MLYSTEVGILGLEWRNWQTHGTQNPARRESHVGSIPTLGTENHAGPGDADIAPGPSCIAAFVSDTATQYVKSLEAPTAESPDGDF